MNKEEISKIALELDQEIEKIRVALEKFQLDVDTIQNGDGNGPYWNGDNAYKCIRTSLLQIEYDTKLLNDLEKKVKAIHTL